MTDIHPSTLYPSPTQSSLLLQYLRKPLTELPTPAAVLDRAIIRRNCNVMLEACKSLGVGFRAHVKSHKTLELAKLQVGGSGPVNFVVSTLIEAENLLPFLRECAAQGRNGSIIYGVPIPQSAIPRLYNLGAALPPGFTLSILIDNVTAFERYAQSIPFDTYSDNSLPEIGIYIKVDTGYRRAGISTSSPHFSHLVRTVLSSSSSQFKGFYSHFGHSYAGSTSEDAASGLFSELRGLQDAVSEIPGSHKGPVVLTVGATPTTTAAQNIFRDATPQTQEIKDLISKLQDSGKYNVELHAGVYPLLDLQQVATGARPATSNGETEKECFVPLSKDRIGLKVLVEVTSTYTERAKPEALISAGSLALGREPCKSYPGWGIVTGDWSGKRTVYDERGKRTGWIVGRISQEHGILSWEGPKEEMEPLTIGQTLMVWPNHACVAGAGFGWYLVVDSEDESGGSEVVDVWVRWRGW